MAHFRLSTLHQLILITLIIAAVIAVEATGLTYYTVQSGVRQLVDTVADDNADRLQLVIRAESELLRQTAFEWADWNETRDFLGEKNPGFIQKNLDTGFINGAGITWLLFYNSTGSLRFGAGRDEKNQFVQVYPDNLGRCLFSDNLIGSLGAAIPRAGLYQAENQSFLLAVHPVTTSEENGPALGTVVAVRELDKNRLSCLTASIPGSVRFNAAIPGETPYIGIISPRQPQAVYDDNSGNITVSIILPDILDRPSFTASMQIPFRTPYGMQVFLTLLGIILIGFGIFIITIYYFFTRFFLRYIPVIGQKPDMAAVSGRPNPSSPDDLPPDIAPPAGSVSRGIHLLDEKQASIIRYEHARKSVEIRWETLFRSAAEAILIGDEEGILTCNPRFESLAGVGCEDLVGIPVTNLPFHSLVGDGAITLRDVWNCPKGKGEQFIWRITPGTDGSDISYVLDVNMRFVEMDGRMLRFLICRDITEVYRMRIEQEQAISRID